MINGDQLGFRDGNGVSIANGIAVMDIGFADANQPP